MMAPKGMEAELYKAAVRGSFEDMSNISNWKEQRTPIKNNILHLYVGKHLLLERLLQRKIMNFMVCYVYTTRNKERMLLKTKSEVNKFIEKVTKDDEGYMLMWESNSNGDTPLHLAAKFGQSNAVEAFLEQATKVNQEEVTKLIKMTNERKDTALHEAARAGHAAVVELLVEADPDCPHHEPNDKCETPLYLAAERGCTSSVISILKTCNTLDYLGYKGPCGRTALHAAVQWGDSEMVSKILENDGRSLMRIQNDEGLTPLHCVAAESSKVELLEILLREDSSAVYIKDQMGRTALHIATLRKNWKAMTSFIDSCPDCIEIVDDEGQNVLHYAAKWTCLAVMKKVVSLDNVNKLINEKDNEGNTPLQVLAASIKPETIETLHPCLNDLSNFKRRNPYLDLQAFNNGHLTVADMLIPNDHLLRQELVFVRSHKVISRGRRINDYKNDVDVEKGTFMTTETWDAKSVKKAAQSRLVGATLIATVSFTAGITVPGGFDQNKGENMGMAVFKDKPLFTVFLASDAIAFTTSTIAILYYVVLASQPAKWAVEGLSLQALIFSTISSGAMMIAFLAGVALITSKPLAGLVIAFCFPFLLFCLYLASMLIPATVRHFYQSSHLNIRNQRLYY